MANNKVFVVLAIFLVFGLSLQQTVTPTPSCSLVDTNNQNRFALKWLSSKGITILSAPEKPVTDICKSEWTTAGTCCKPETVVEYSKQNNEGMAGKWRSYIAKLTKVKHKFMQGLRKIEKKMNAKDIQNKLSKVNQNAALNGKFGQAAMLLPATDAQVKIVKDWILQFDDNIKTFRTQGRECFNTMKTVRSNLLCAACSANAQTYTSAQSDTNVVFRVAQDTCTAVVESCFPIWKFNFYLTTLMQFVNILRLKNKGNSLGSKFMSQLQMTTATINEVKDSFEKCSIGADKKLTCTTLVTDHIAKLCKNLFSVNKENGYAEGDDTFDEDVADNEVENLDAEVENTAAVRLLQTTTAEANVAMEVAPTSSGVFTQGTATGPQVPATSVDTSNAGDQGASSAKLLASGLAFLLALFALSF
jgi:hypothetical protein